MPVFLLLAILAAQPPGAEPLIAPVVSAPVMVRRVAIRGTLLKVDLSTQVGQPYDARVVEQDLRKLWSTGRFEDIRVEQERQADGTAVVFQVVEARILRLHKIVAEPANSGVKVTLAEGSPISRPRAQAVAREAKMQLNAQGYENARVDAQLVAAGVGQVDLHLTITPGARIRVKQVEFTGKGAEDSKELRHSLRALQVRRILGFPLHPGYSREAVDADIARVRSLYLLKGYFDARVQLEGIDIQQNRAEITILVEPGPRYRVQDGRSCNVCESLFRERRKAERQGILDFSATLHVERADDTMHPAAMLSTTIERGTPYRVGRIQFAGNLHYADARLRSNFRLDEGQLLDGRLLRQSIEHVNQGRLFEPIDASQVVIRASETAGAADVIVKLTEKKRGAWRLSGPVGPFSFAGPLEASISSRLPPWGSGLFNLATYTASVSLFAFARPILPLLAASPKRPLLPVLALARPFSPDEGWRSGFTFAPQLGWRAIAFTYSSTQITERLLPKLAGDRDLAPELAVAIDDPKGAGTMFCDPPPPRFAKFRSVAGMGLRLLGAFAGI